MNTIERIQFNRITRDVLVAGILQTILLCRDYVALIYSQGEKRTGRCEISYELYEQLPELVQEYAAITAGVPIELEQPVPALDRKELLQGLVGMAEKQLGGETVTNAGEGFVQIIAKESPNIIIAQVPKLEQQLGQHAAPPVSMPQVQLEPLPYQQEIEQWSALRACTCNDSIVFVAVQDDLLYITFRQDAIRLASFYEDELDLLEISQTLDAYVVVDVNVLDEIRHQLLQFCGVLEVGICYAKDETLTMYYPEPPQPKKWVIPQNNPVIDLTATITQYEQTGKMELVEPEKPTKRKKKKGELPDLREVEKHAWPAEEPTHTIVEPVPCENCSKPCYPDQEHGLCEQCEALVDKLLVVKQYHSVADIPTTAAGPQFPEWYAHRMHNGFADPNGPMWVANGNLQSSCLHGTLIDWMLHYEKRDGIYLAAHNTGGGTYIPMGLAGMYHTLLAYFLGKLLGAHLLFNDAGERDESSLHDFVGSFANQQVSFAELTELVLDHRKNSLDKENLERGELLARLASKIQAFQQRSEKFTAAQRQTYEASLSALQDITLDPTMPAGYAFWRALLKGKLLLTRAESQLLRFCMERY